MRMYILVKEEVPTGFAMVAVAHASLATYLKFKDHENVKAWLAGPFRKTICKVNSKEFESAKSFEEAVIITESALDNQEVAIAFCPREDWPKPFKYYRLYR